MRAELGMKLPAAGRLFVAACTGKKTRGSPGNCPTCSAECRRCPRAAGGHGITYIVWSGDLFLPRLSLASWFNVRMSSHWLSDPRAPGILWRFPQLFQGAWWRDSRCCWSERFRGFGGRDSFQRHAADLHAWANLSQLEPKLFFSIFLKQILELKHGFRSVMRTEPQRSNAFPVKCEHESNMLRFVGRGSSRRASDTVGAGTSTQSHGPAAASSGVSSQGSKWVQAVHSRPGERMGATGNRLLPCQVQSRQCQALEMEFLGPRPAVWDHTWTALCHRARWSTMCPMCPVSHKRWLAAIQFFYRDSFAHFVKIACRRGARRLAWTSGKSWWGCKMNVLNWYLDTEQFEGLFASVLFFNIWQCVKTLYPWWTSK